MFLIQRYDSISASSVYSAVMCTQPTNHGTRFAKFRSTKNEHVCQQPTLLDNIECWPTFNTWWTFVGQHCWTTLVCQHLFVVSAAQHNSWTVYTSYKQDRARASS